MTGLFVSKFMKKNYNGRGFLNANNSSLSNHSIEDFEIFKSKVAHAVLDYMEAQTDLELIDSLEKAAVFLTNISVQMEKVFDNERQIFKEQNDLIEISDDLFPAELQTSSNSIH